MGLWKKKHETGQWLEIGATEAIASQPDASIMNASGIVFSNSEMASEGDGKLSMDGTAGKETNSLGFVLSRSLWYSLNMSYLLDSFLFRTLSKATSIL